MRLKRYWPAQMQAACHQPQGTRIKVVITTSTSPPKPCCRGGRGLIKKTSGS